MTQKLNITIKIANLPPIPLTIQPHEEATVRQAEANVNRLWNNWRERFNVSQSDVLAMVAFQFAKLHAAQSQQNEQYAAQLQELDATLDNMLQRNDG